MTSKDLSIFNSLRPFSIGFDDYLFDESKESQKIANFLTLNNDGVLTILGSLKLEYEKNLMLEKL